MSEGRIYDKIGDEVAGTVLYVLPKGVPRMGAFGIVSPRTCGDCSMIDTLWMALQSGKIKGIDDMTVDQRVVLARIQNEPASITPPTNS